MSGYQIPFTGLKRQYNNLREEILHVTDEVLSSGQLMDGKYTDDFEVWLSLKNNTRHAITCHSGTQALEIIASFYAQRSSTNPPRIFIPTFTFPASANAFIRCGWEVEFVDTDAYGIIDLSKTSADRSYQAILGIGLYGAALPEWLRQSTRLIEDAAQHWLADDCRRAGGNGAAISFDPMKNLGNYGNGGAVVTTNTELYNYARGWVNNGKSTTHAEIGTNSRMSEVDCAQMLVKTRYIDQWQDRRKTIAWEYMQRFKDQPLRCLINKDNFHKHAFHKFVIDVDNRDDVQQKLKYAGIETKVHYQHPLHELPAYQHCQGPNILSAASSLSRRCLSLPIYPELTDSEVEHIVNAVLTSVS